LLYYFNNFQILQNLLNISILSHYTLEFGTANLVKIYGFQTYFEKYFNFFDRKFVKRNSSFSSN